MTWYLEILLPGWVLLSVIVNAIRRDQRLSLANACMGIAAYGMVRIGAVFLIDRPIEGGVLFAVGHAVLFGWAVSPGGSRLLWEPIGALTRYWPEAVGRDAPECGRRLWSASSSRVAAVMLILDTLWIGFIVMCYINLGFM